VSDSIRANLSGSARIFPATRLEPEPPVTPIGMGKQARGVELASVDELDEPRIASWMQQAATMPFAGGK
jgi:hypothetical protein